MTQEQVFEIVDRDGWKATPDRDLLFSSDHVIEAYFKGKDAGQRTETSLAADQIGKNLQKSSELTANILDNLRGRNFSPGDIFLRIASQKFYEILITLPENEFLNDEILEVYSFLGELQQKEASNYYNVDVTLCPFSERLNIDCLTADGFIFRYTGN
jgi:hypothetical protein